MRIITISREFGSGGRELAKRLSDELGFAYYDREIIDEISKKSNLDPDYVDKLLENGLSRRNAITFGHTFSMPDPRLESFTKLRLIQQDFIKSLAKKNEDFIIVGRAADVILKEYEPLNIFVYAGMDSKIDRCIDRLSDDEEYTEREMARKIRKIDAGRAVYRQLLTDSPWGEKTTYDLMVNTTYKNIKSLVPAVAEFAKAWFESKK